MVKNERKEYHTYITRNGEWTADLFSLFFFSSTSVWFVSSVERLENVVKVFRIKFFERKRITISHNQI